MIRLVVTLIGLLALMLAIMVLRAALAMAQLPPIFVWHKVTSASNVNLCMDGTNPACSVTTIGGQGVW